MSVDKLADQAKAELTHVCMCVCSREPISVGSYVCTRPALQGPVALLGPDLRPNRVFH